MDFNFTDEQQQYGDALRRWTPGGYAEHLRQTYAP